MENKLKYDVYHKFLKENEPLKKRVSEYLEYKYQLDSSLKGFSYMVDIISLSLILKKYSRTTIEHLKHFIAYKHDIKPFSVQRQLRYTCTVKSKYLPINICEESWYTLRNEIEYGLIKIKQKGEKNTNEN